MSLNKLPLRVKPAQMATIKAAPINPNFTPRTRGSVWMARRARWLKHQPVCVMCLACGRTSAASQVDHVIPLIDGGRDDESNYQSLCEPCHIAKTAEEAAARSRYR
jgi:5-methylcytosine-specific restriction enzyme A